MDSTTQRATRGNYSAEESASRMTAPATPSGSSAGWKTESVTMEAADNGGFIVRCSKTKPSKDGSNRGLTPSGNNYKSTNNAFQSLDAAIAYVRSEFAGAAGAASDGDGTDAEDAADEAGDDETGEV